MRAFRVHYIPLWRNALVVALALAAFCPPCPALDKPTGAPLVISTIETEQSVPLVFLDPDGKTAHCANVTLHWTPNPQVGPAQQPTGFTLDLPAENPGTAVFTAQLWSASLASALAWQQPWPDAHWKVIQTPVTNGTGIDAGLAVGMIATSARRPYPPKTVVIGNLNPDGSLGPVSLLAERLDAAAAAGMTRVIISGAQRFDTDPTGQVINVLRHADDLHLECVPVDNLVEATEAAMNDPLPDIASDSAAPKYDDEISAYIQDFANREQSMVGLNLKFAPSEADLAKYPQHMAHLAELWKSVYADQAAGEQAYHAGQVYMAYRFFCHANGTMSGINALIGQNRASFDVKAALTESDDLRNHLHGLMNPPSIDKGELQSAVLVAEMADWAYEINAALEGAQLVTKQTFSQRSDATEPERDRAREAILFANEQSKYLLGQADFYHGMITSIEKESPVFADENAARLLPQLIPAQLATARIFTEGIRERASDLRVGLLFDPRLVAYVSVLQEMKTDWDARQRKKEMQAEAVASAPDANQAMAPAKSAGGSGPVGFDPGNTYAPPHTVLVATEVQKKISDVAQCLIWANTDCEIAALDEKYLRLGGTIDPATHEWHVKDRAKLDALLQTAETGARQGVAFAEKAQVDPSVLAMIYERAAYQRSQSDDASGLNALRNYWRCALLGNLCWQLAPSRKAEPVDLGSMSSAPEKPAKSDKPLTKTEDTKKDATVDNHVAPTPVVKPVTPVVVPIADHQPVVTNTVVAENPPPPVPDPPVPHRALPVVLPDTNDSSTNANPGPPVVPSSADAGDANIPVAPVAKVEDYSGAAAPPSTNAPPAPVIGPVAPPQKTDNADGHAGAFP